MNGDRASGGTASSGSARLVCQGEGPACGEDACSRARMLQTVPVEGAGMAPSQLFGWRRQARVARGYDQERNSRRRSAHEVRERFAAVSCALVEIVIGEVVLRPQAGRRLRA